MASGPIRGFSLGPVGSIRMVRPTICMFLPTISLTQCVIVLVRLRCVCRSATSRHDAGAIKHHPITGPLTRGPSARDMTRTPSSRSERKRRLKRLLHHCLRDMSRTRDDVNRSLDCLKIPPEATTFIAVLPWRQMRTGPSFAIRLLKNIFPRGAPGRCASLISSRFDQPSLASLQSPWRRDVARHAKDAIKKSIERLSDRVRIVPATFFQKS